MNKPLIDIEDSASSFEQEKLIRSFGFKGNYLTALWQVASQLTSANGYTGLGLSTQSVLYSDASLFAKHTETAGNSLMYKLTQESLSVIEKTLFFDPIHLQEQILPQITAIGKRLTNKDDLHINFMLNALVSIDHAAWLVYAGENQLTTFNQLLPDAYQSSLSYRNNRLAIAYQIPYNMPIDDVKQAAKQGYFVFKIKTGFPGDQEQMLQRDSERLLQIHEVLRHCQTPYTSDGKIRYTMDANGRYEKKETLLRYLDYAENIGARQQILFYEEPFTETNEEDISDLEIRIAGDESIVDEKSAYRRIEQGYQTFILKGIAKTLSLSIKIAKIAHERNIPCAFSDLTVNPILVDWHKNLVCRYRPFPDIGMGLIETNGQQNYKNWERMCSYHPLCGKSWTSEKNGVFILDDDYYENSGGIFKESDHYQEHFTKR
ncbi:L-alanine-DL-glutamate epimerase [Olivibacter sp. SDN3]|uniref:enolase C-terminal domain-like protein n=1 Tax=Olivibacter sp. SDN3 TaxID=2764720 RepID=UPI0016516DB2|nr:enolase C-terminal domain-like protein [Olivibacter sp. SDN3]QNL49288.1 L-alanine-DL-glutamate epimerase [Olivibacter sp. SDN3]